jgi:enoyl-CoA hydratase/carnithine racemase
VPASGGDGRYDPGRSRPYCLSDRFHQAIFVPGSGGRINPQTLGGGFDVAVLTDLRIASDTAHFAHPENTWGEVIYRPPRDLVGGAVARGSVLTGRRIDREEAPAVGLVSRVVPADTLAGMATQLPARIAAGPRVGPGTYELVRMKMKMVAAAVIPATATTLEL